MSEDVNDKIEQIITMLAKLNSPPQQTHNDQQDQQSANKENSRKQYDEIDTELLNSVKSIMRGLNTKNDTRINLLKSIKPYLNIERQEKINTCMMILQLAEISKMLDKEEIDKGE